MRTLALSIIASLAVSIMAMAAPKGGVSGNSPGHMMQKFGPVSGSPGASGYAPGHLKKLNGSVRGYPGASGYAPGRRVTTTGSGVR